MNQTLKLVVLYVDICHSTAITRQMKSAQRKKYYEPFLNEMVNVANDFGGYPFKTAGDEVIVFFPETGSFAFADNSIICGLMMIETVRKVISPFLETQGLPSLTCRVSTDYGEVTLVRIDGMIPPVDYVGNVMNFAGKFLKKADENTMLIGQNLFEVIYTDYRLACALKGELDPDGETYKFYQVNYKLP